MSNRKFASIIKKLSLNDYWLTTLNLDCIGLDDNDIKKLANALINNTKLEYLYLGGIISSIGINELSIALSFNNSITRLDLYNNNIGDAGVSMLVKSLKTNTKLCGLMLIGNDITDIGVKELANMLINNTTLVKLELRNNKITDVGIKQLSNALIINNTLTHLYLAHNKLTDIGIDIIATLLTNNNTLTHLSVSPDLVSTAGLRNLAKSLKNNQTLIYFGINCWGTHYDISEIIRKTLQRNINFKSYKKHLDMLGDVIPDEVTQIISNHVAYYSYFMVETY